MKASICIEMVFPELPYEARIEEVARAGFRYIEFWDWRNKDLDGLRRACSASGVRIVNFSGQRRGDLIAAETHPLLLKDYAETLRTAKALGTGTLMVLTNELGEGGTVKHPHPEIPPHDKEENVRKGLRMLLDNTPVGMNVVLEPLNTVLDHEGYFLSSIEQAGKLTGGLADERLRVLCDLYHQGMMGDDLLSIIEEGIGRIGYFHVADFPGRHEPGTGSGDWKRILKRIQALGYDGFVGFEYAPARDSGESLRRIRELWESL